MPSKLPEPGSSHQMAQQLGTTGCNHWAELFLLAFQNLNLAFSKAREVTKKSEVTSCKYVSSTKSLRRRSSLAHLFCTVCNVLGLGLYLKPSWPAAISMSLTLSAKEEDPGQGPPDHLIFIPHDPKEVVIQRQTKSLGAGESWHWVSQTLGLFVTRAVTCTDMAKSSCLPSKNQVHGRPLWLSLYAPPSTPLLWPTGWSMDVKLISSSSSKTGSLDCAMWTMWVQRPCRVSL